MIGGNAIGIIFRVLFPGPVGLLYQVPLAAAVAWVVLRREAPDRGAEEHLWPLVGIIGAGGPLALFVISRMPLPGAPLLALAAHWVGVSLLLDHYLDVDFDQSYGLTGAVVGPTWLLTLTIGAVLIVLGA